MLQSVGRRLASRRLRGFLASPRPLLHMRLLDFRNIQFNENVLGFYLVSIYARTDRQTSDTDTLMSREHCRGIVWSV